MVKQEEVRRIVDSRFDQIERRVWSVFKPVFVDSEQFGHIRGIVADEIWRNVESNVDCLLVCENEDGIKKQWNEITVSLCGRMLTIVDAYVSELQKKAVKDIMRRAVWQYLESYQNTVADMLMAE